MGSSSPIPDSKPGPSKQTNKQIPSQKTRKKKSMQLQILTLQQQPPRNTKPPYHGHTTVIGLSIHRRHFTASTKKRPFLF